MIPVSVQFLNEEPDIAVIRLSGEIGLEQVPRISAQLEEFERRGALHWAVDLSAVEFLSSPAVGVIMGLRSRMVARHGSVSLLSASRELSKKLKLMGVDFAIPSYQDLDAFLNAFRWEHRRTFRELRLVLPAQPLIVPPTRRLVAEILTGKGYGSKDVFVLETIVDELANNAIEHGQPPDGVFAVQLKFDCEKITLTVFNRCKALSDSERKALIERYENPFIEPGSFRGRGIALVKKLSSQMTWRIEAESVEVEIVRNREGI